MIEITYEPLDPEAITDRVRSRTAGAVLTFLGTTRDSTADRDVLYLEYEAYAPMAEKKLSEVAQEMMDRWPLTGVAISHRTVGWRHRLAVGDNGHQPRRGRCVAAPWARIRGRSVQRRPSQAGRAYLEEGIFQRRRGVGGEPRGRCAAGGGGGLIDPCFSLPRLPVSAIFEDH